MRKRMTYPFWPFLQVHPNLLSSMLMKTNLIVYQNAVRTVPSPESSSSSSDAESSEASEANSLSSSEDSSASSESSSSNSLADSD